MCTHAQKHGKERRKKKEQGTCHTHTHTHTHTPHRTVSLGCANCLLNSPSLSVYLPTTQMVESNALNSQPLQGANTALFR